MVTAGTGAPLVTLRRAPNVWWVALTDMRTAALDVFAELGPTSMPSEALTQLAGRAAGEPAALIAKLELDVCGAWLTVANASAARPVVVRRAGWVDLRGHPVLRTAGPARRADDRVGLGPADVLVLHSTSGASARESWNDEVVDACLESSGRPPAAVTDAVHARVGGDVAALGVPADLGTDPLQRVAAATGTPATDVRSPGYPLGDLQPDLWQQPPQPPRLARLRLSAERSSVADVRTLLDRLLASWRLEARLDPDDVKLVASELAANAIVHSGAPETVTVRYLGDIVRIEVTDHASDHPRPRAAGDEDVDGRGFQLIEALSSAWGTEQLDHGKRVWCELAVSN